MEDKPRESTWVMWRWPIVALIIFAGILLTANRFLNRATKTFAPVYKTSTIIQTSVTRLRQEAKLVVLSADVTVEVTRTSSKILWERLDLGDTVATVRTRGNRAQYFVPLEKIEDRDFQINGGNVVVTVPEPRVDETIVEVQSDPEEIEIRTEIGWGRLDRRSGELARAEARRGMREAVISEAKSPVYVELARKNAKEKVSALLTPLLRQMGVTNLTVQFRR